MTVRGALVIVPLALAACHDLVGNPPLPAGTEDPSVYNTPAGALRFAEGTLELLKLSGSEYVISSGLFTDELSSNDANVDSVDARQVYENSNPAKPSSYRTDIDYEGLQKLRGQARVARGAVAKYAPSASPAVRGRLYAMEGYVDILLADLFCSGVPLSTVNFEKDFTYRAGSTTAEIYTEAAALFDSAASLASDSADVLTFARVGKGRALLGLGQYAAAAAAVADVPNGSSFSIRVILGSEGVIDFQSRLPDVATVSDREGLNGLPYRTSGDPRTSADTLTVNVIGIPSLVFFPDKYFPNKADHVNGAQPDSTSLVLADFIEARLIQAEADLKAGGSQWLTILNTLRTSGSYSAIDTTVVAIDNSVTPPDTTFRIDTLWNAGTGGVARLGPLHDPGTATARVDTLFAERARWLFLTGHRQGDLRRLVRQYGRRQQDVYPTGSYPRLSVYGAQVTAPVPVEERINPLFHGCFNHDA